MLNHRDDRPLSELMTGLVADISGLFRKEIDLAKAEASENVNRAIGSLETLLIGLIFATANSLSRLAPPERSTPEYLRAFVASEIDKWAGAIKASGIQID